MGSCCGSDSISPSLMRTILESGNRKPELHGGEVGMNFFFLWMSGFHADLSHLQRLCLHKCVFVIEFPNWREVAIILPGLLQAFSRL